MARPDQVVSVFRQWVTDGVREIPDGSNQTVIGREFGYDRVAWCAESCSVALKRVKQRGFWTASVAQAIADAKARKNGLRWIAANEPCAAGDFACFDWKGHRNPADFHISCVIDPGTQAKFHTIGGNENNRVTDQWRDRTYVQGFIRPDYDAAPPQQEDDLTPDEHTMLVETAARAKNLESAADQYKAPLAALQKDVDEIKAALASGAAGPTAAQIADEIAKRLKD